LKLNESNVGEFVKKSASFPGFFGDSNRYVGRYFFSCWC